jgi:TP901 family phage tail tape measure protein
MSTVQAVTSATGEEMEKLSALARDMGKNTRYSASEAAGAQENLARAGFTTGEIMDALGSTLNLATSGALSLDEASGIAARTIRGFGLEASEAGRVADVLAYTAAATNTTVGGLGETFKYVAPTAAGLGIEMEEVAAAAGLMGDAGIDAGQAGNMLRRGLLNLASPTAQQADLLNALGLEMFDAEGNMKPLVEVVGELEKGLDGMTAQQQTAALSTLFGAQAVSGWTAIVNEGSDSLADLTGRIRESDGYAQQFAETAEDNLAGSFRSMRSSLEEAMLSIYEFGQGPIRDLVERLTGLIDKFSEMDPAMQQVIIIVGILAASIGPLLMLIGQIGLGVSALGTFFVGTAGSASMFATILGALTSPVTLVIAAIGALIAILVYFYNTNETVREVVNAAWAKVKSVITTVINAVSGLVTSVWGTLTSFWVSNNELIRNTATTVWNAIKAVITTAINIIKPLVIGAWNAISIVTSGVWNTIKVIIDGAMNAVLGIIKTIMQIITGDWRGAWNTMKGVVSGVISSVISTIKSLGNISLLDAGRAIINGFVNGMKGAWDAGKKFVGGIGGWIARNKGPISYDRRLLKPAGNAIISGLNKGLQDSFPDVQKTVKGIAGAINETMTGGPIVDISGSVAKSNAGVSRVISHELNNNMSTRPAYINVNIGGQNFRGFVENISNEQGKITDLELQF